MWIVLLQFAEKAINIDPNSTRIDKSECCKNKDRRWYRDELECFFDLLLLMLFQVLETNNLCCRMTSSHLLILRHISQNELIHLVTFRQSPHSSLWENSLLLNVLRVFIELSISGNRKASSRLILVWQLESITRGSNFIPCIRWG